MKLRFICWFLLLSRFIRVTGEERLVYRESYVLLFENVIADNLEKDVSLYINGAKQPSLIVIFKFGNGAITSEWRMYNYTKIFIDSNRNIKIANIDKSYEGKYYIQSSGRREVELTVSDNLTDEVTKITQRLEEKQEVIIKYLDNLTDDVTKTTQRLKDIQEVMKYLGNLTIKIRKIAERLDDDHSGSWALKLAILVIVTVSLGASLPLCIPLVWKMLKNGWLRCRKFDNDPTSGVAVDSKTQKVVKTSKRKGVHRSNNSERNYNQLHTKQPTDSANMKYSVTKGLLLGEDDTDSEAMNISGGTNPNLPRGADPHSPRLPHPDGNIPVGTDPDLPRGADPHSPRLPHPDRSIPGKADPHLQLLLAVHKNNSENDDFLPTAQGKNKIDIRET